jgi:hypothetical protein
MGSLGEASESRFENCFTCVPVRRSAPGPTCHVFPRSRDYWSSWTDSRVSEPAQPVFNRKESS